MKRQDNCKTDSYFDVNWLREDESCISDTLDKINIPRVMPISKKIFDWHDIIMI